MFVSSAFYRYDLFMDLARLVDRIECVDIAGANVAQLATLMGDVGCVKGWIAQIEAAAAHRAGELEGAGKAGSAVDLIARGTKTSHRAAEKTRRRGDALAESPEVERQLAAGRISAEHADALATAADKLGDEHRDALFERDLELADQAAQQTPAQFARTLARTVQEISRDDGIERSEQQRRDVTLTHGINHDTGMGWIRADLHPDDYQRVKTRLNAEISAMKHGSEYDGLREDQRGAIALIGLVTGGRLKAQAPPSVAVMVDYQTITTGLHATSICEYADGTALPVEAARRHACDAKIIPVVLDSHGMPIDVGRGARHATPAQRTALRSMYRTCAVDGCERSFDRCEMHHILEWLNLGDTDLDNLLPLCAYHHHRVHEGRWRLQLDPSTRQLDVFLPDGSRHSRCVPDIIAERSRTNAA